MLSPIYIDITICLNYLTKVLRRIYFLFYTVSSWYDIRNHVNTMPILQVNSRSSVKVFSRLDIWILVKTPPILQFSSWCLVGHIYPDGDDVRLETISICSFYESFIKTWQQEPCQDTHVIQVSSWCLGEHGHSWGTSSWCLTGDNIWSFCEWFIKIWSFCERFIKIKLVFAVLEKI